MARRPVKKAVPGWILSYGNFIFRFRNAIFPLLFVILLFRSPRILGDDRAAFLAGLLVLAAGQALRALSVGLEYIVRGGRQGRIYAEKLVTGGMFAHCRNPLYVGNFLIGLGLSLAVNSAFYLYIGVPFLLFSYYAIVMAEEDFLRGKYGRRYDAYCACVPRFVPDFRGIRRTFRLYGFHWRRLLVKEYNTAYAWTGGLAAFLLLRTWVDPSPFASPSSRPLLTVLLAVLTLLYLTARQLKKSGVVKGD